MTRYLRANHKQQGEITPRRTSRILGVHIETVYNWCRQAADGRGPLAGSVRQSITGWYYIDADTVKIMSNGHGKTAPEVDEKKPT